MYYCKNCEIDFDEPSVDNDENVGYRSETCPKCDSDDITPITSVMLAKRKAIKNIVDKITNALSKDEMHEFAEYQDEIYDILF